MSFLILGIEYYMSDDVDQYLLLLLLNIFGLRLMILEFLYSLFSVSGLCIVFWLGLCIVIWLPPGPHGGRPGPTAAVAVWAASKKSDSMLLNGHPLTETWAPSPRLMLACGMHLTIASAIAGAGCDVRSNPLGCI